VTSNRRRNQACGIFFYPNRSESFACGFIFNQPFDLILRNIMNADHNKLIVRRYFEEVLLDGRADLIDELFAPEICDLVRRFAFFEAGSFHVSAVMAEGDTVMAHWHKSSFSDEEPVRNGFAAFHLDDGKIIGLEMIDFDGILRQIGAEVLHS
jgi:hypothetical protein